MAILNVAGFYDSLIAFVDTMVQNGFLKQVNRDMLLVANNIDELLLLMQNYKAPEVGKWISKETT